LNHSITKDPRGIKVILSLLTLVLRNCQNSLQLDLYITSVLQVISILMNDRSSLIFRDFGVSSALFDAIMSILGLLNVEIHQDNIGLKFGFLTLTQMLKSSQFSVQQNFQNQGDQASIEFNADIWSANLERIEKRITTIFGH